MTCEMELDCSVM